jgi:hypothetical protein
VFLVVVNQTHRRWIIFKTFKSRTLSNLRRKVGGWFLLKSAKNRFLGVDHPGQYVPPCVRYGTTCILIWELWIYALFESNREVYGYTWDSPDARGALDGETLAECKTDLKGPL